MITVIENILEEKDALFAESTMLGNYFPWFINLETVNDRKKLSNGFDSPQFTHCFVRDGVQASTQGYGYIDVLMKKIIDLHPKHKLFRVKANLNVQSSQMGNNHYPAHTDAEFPCISAIYYVTNSDGDTLFFNKNMEVVQRVVPKRNTLVYFDGGIMHAGMPPKKSFSRCLINFVIKP